MSRPKIDAIYPLSPSQQGMFFESRAGRGLHVEQVGCTLAGPLDAQAFRDAWQQVMGRHAVLRTAIIAKNQDEPLQVVLAEVKPPLTVEDWSHLPAAEAETRFAQLMESEARQGFEMSKAPLMRMVLVALGPQRHRFLWSFHHILLDGWCLPLVMRDLFAAFAGKVLPPPAAAYGDYVAWLRRQDREAAERFWRGRLAGFQQPTRPGRASGITTAPMRHGEVTASLDATATQAVSAALRRNRLTLNTLAQGVWAVLLGHCAEAEDVVFGITVSGRPPDIRGVEDVVGPFFNTVPLRVGLSVPPPTMAAWLDALQGGQLEAQRFEWCSAGQIHEWADLPGGESLFETMLVFENYPVGAASESLPQSLQIEKIEAAGARTTQLLTVLVAVQDTMNWRVVFDAERLAHADVARLVDLYRDLVPLVAANLDRPLSWLRDKLPCDWRPALKKRAVGTARPGPDPVAPRTSVELTLVRLWEDLFGISPIGVRDDFFALGGHSLLVLQVMKRIEAAFGVKLPPAAIMDAPTIEHLALAVTNRQDKAVWSSLVSLKSSGSKRPLFAVHPLGGHVICYADMMRLFDPDRPLYGLQAPGLEEGQQPFLCMEDMAASYIAAIRQVQPTGPYLLAGYSFGGLVAWEMACQLGGEVALVALLDTPNSNTIAHEKRFPDSAAMLFSLFSESLDLDLDALRRLEEREQVAHVLELAKKADLVAPETGMDEALRYFNLSRINQLMAFPGRPYGGRVVLFRGREGALRLTDDPMQGWQHIAAAGVEVVWTPGSHETMLAQPHAETIVDLLHQSLAAADL